MEERGVSAAHGAEAREPRDAPHRHMPETDWLGWASAAVTVLGFTAVLYAWRAGGFAVTLPWAPRLDLHLSLALDGLGATATRISKSGRC